jgi:germacradienol/geosmin synthase
MTRSWIWELINQVQNRVPDPIDYVEMRRKTFGADLTMHLAWLSHHGLVSEELLQTRQVRGMENTVADYACLLNDVLSYQKEIQFEGELSNGVLVVETFLSCDRDRAVGVVNDLMTARMRQFQRIVAVELPVLFEQLDLDAGARAVLETRAGELQDYLAGVHHWHMTTRRYDEAELRPDAWAWRPAGVPHGLGTSAARIG